ncbi:MAG: histidine--tRNA ligase [Patescibacteria group bacterium]|nr:histidine--tRNA ligase [Patescibacteria group bacterium]
MTKKIKRKVSKKQKKKILSKPKKEKFIPQLLRGMKDILPEEQKYWDYLLEKLEKLSKIYGFEKIETPILEETTLFQRSIGLTTDIVEKEMFSFIDKGGRSIALRPEGTAGVARAYLEHGLSNLPQPVKLFYFGPMFRYEKPQEGRQREFHQFGLEVFGASHHIVEAQILLLSWNFFREIKLETELQINSLGCLECRKEYQKRLFEFFRYKRKLLCSICQIRLEKNPLRIFDCKEKKCQEITSQLPHLIDSLCENCKNHFIKVLEYLDELEIPYNLNPYLVRGLDYYTKTVFEFWPQRVDLSQEERAKLALAAGGRYDGLIKLLGGKETPACGIAFGLERIIEEMKIQNLHLPKEKKPQIFLAQIGETAKKKSLRIFERLRQEGFLVKEALAKDSLKAQLEMANKLGVKLALIFGQEEVVHKTIIIRNMQTGVQEIVDLEKIIMEIKKRL